MADYAADKVELVQYREKDPTKIRNSVLEAFTLPAWSLHEQPSIEGKIETKQPPGSASAQKYSYYTWKVVTDRHYASYLWNIGFLLYLVATLSVVTFFLESDDVGSRTSTTLTLVLAAVALKFVTNDSLPKISYLTLMDYYIFFCFFVLYAITIITAVACRLTHLPSSNLWNQWLCMGFLITWTTVHVGILIGTVIFYQGPPTGTDDERNYGCCWRNQHLDGAPRCCAATPLLYGCCVASSRRPNSKPDAEPAYDFKYRWTCPRVETVIFSIILSVLLIILVSQTDLAI